MANSNPHDLRLLDLRAARARCGDQPSLTWWRRMASERRIPVIKLSNRVYLRESDLAKLIEGHLIPARGGRLTDLALAMRISKQGLGQLATSLAAGGYIEMLPDPGDNRAKIIRRTPIGDELKDAMRSAIANVEQRWRTEVGDERYATLLDALQQLAGTGREPSLPNKPGP